MCVCVCECVCVCVYTCIVYIYVCVCVCATSEKHIFHTYRENELGRSVGMELQINRYIWYGWGTALQAGKSWFDSR